MLLQNKRELVELVTGKAISILGDKPTQAVRSSPKTHSHEAESESKDDAQDCLPNMMNFQVHGLKFCPLGGFLGDACKLHKTICKPIPTISLLSQLTVGHSPCRECALGADWEREGGTAGVGAM